MVDMHRIGFEGEAHYHGADDHYWRVRVIIEEGIRDTWKVKIAQDSGRYQGGEFHMESSKFVVAYDDERPQLAVEAACKRARQAHFDRGLLAQAISEAEEKLHDFWDFEVADQMERNAEESQRRILGTSEDDDELQF